MTIKLEKKEKNKLEATPHTELQNEEVPWSTVQQRQDEESSLPPEMVEATPVVEDGFLKSLLYRKSNKQIAILVAAIAIIILALVICLSVFIPLAIANTSQEEANSSQGQFNTEIPTETPVDMPTANVCDPCPDNKQFRLNSIRLSFPEHLSRARQQGCNLATIQDTSEALQILQILQAANLPKAHNHALAFVGLMRFREDPLSWRWTSRSDECPMIRTVDAMDPLWAGVTDIEPNGLHIEPNGGQAGEIYGAMFWDHAVKTRIGRLADVPSWFQLSAIYECC